MSAVRSMTGFAGVEETLKDGRAVSVRIKGVNARHLEVQVRLPAGMDEVEPELRALVKGSVRRGHVELTVYAERGSGGMTVSLDEVLIGAYVEAYRRTAERFGLTGEPDLNVLMRIPGVMVAGGATGFDAATLDQIRACTAGVLATFQETRAAEGAALAGALREGITRLQGLTEEAAHLRRSVAVSAVDRLRGRLEELAGEQLAVGPERLLTEAALLVARGDVEEELVRLRTHLERFTELLDAGDEVGKALEFLLQELNREANTLLSKTGGAAGEQGLRLTDVGLAMKVELERAREQIQNLE